jgi:serine/threonine protein kinase
VRIDLTPKPASEQFGDESDVFSFGLILYEIIVGRSVFSPKQDVHTVMKRFGEGELVNIPRTVPKGVAKLIRRCWKVDPKRRYSFDEIMKQLKGLDFRILPGVKSWKVADYVSEVELWEEKQSQVPEGAHLQSST